MNRITCWCCDKEFEYDGEKYRDMDCEYCGVQNSIYNPADKLPQTEEEEMGKLSDRAREKSPYLKLDIGSSSVELVYKSWKETTDNFGNDTFRYFFDLVTDNGIITKQFDNRSQSFAEAMDVIEFGKKVILTREQKLDNDGEIVENKSFWTVKVVE